MGKWHHGGRLLKTRAGVEEQGLCRMRQEGWRKKKKPRRRRRRVP